MTKKRDEYLAGISEEEKVLRLFLDETRKKISFCKKRISNDEMVSIQENGNQDYIANPKTCIRVFKTVLKALKQELPQAVYTSGHMKWEFSNAEMTMAGIRMSRCDVCGRWHLGDCGYQYDIDLGENGFGTSRRKLCDECAEKYLDEPFALLRSIDTTMLLAREVETND